MHHLFEGYVVSLIMSEVTTSLLDSKSAFLEEEPCLHREGMRVAECYLALCCLSLCQKLLSALGIRMVSLLMLKVTTHNTPLDPCYSLLA